MESYIKIHQELLSDEHHEKYRDTSGYVEKGIKKCSTGHIERYKQKYNKLHQHYFSAR